MTEFAILRVQVFDPISRPDGGGYPPRVEILVEGMDIEKPTDVLSRDDWMVVRYGPCFYLFFHEGSLGQKSVHDAEYDEESLTFHEGVLNTRSDLVPEPLFPVTVAVSGAPGNWREYFVPVSIVEQWIEQFEQERAHPLGAWRLVASTDWAKRSQIVFELEFTPHHRRPIRAEAARRPR